MNNSRSRKRSSRSDRTNTTDAYKSSPYDPNFEQKLIDSGVYPDNRASKPGNWQEIQEHLRAARSSLSPSRFDDDDFERFQKLCQTASREPRTMQKAVSVVEGQDDTYFTSGGTVLFTKLEKFDKDLSVPKPDVYDGARPEQINSDVRKRLDKHVTPSNATSLPAVPNFFLEGKSAKGRADIAMLQACHDGAVGARAMHSLQNYEVETPIYDGNAYTFTNTYHGGTGTLQMFTTHPTAPTEPGGRPEYHMTQLRSFAMTDTPDRFREGATAFRNARDLSKANRDSFIEQANEAARQMPADTPSSTLIDRRTSLSAVDDRDSNTSEDEFAAELVTTKRSRRAPPQSSSRRQVLEAVVVPPSRVEGRTATVNERNLLLPQLRKSFQAVSSSPPTQVQATRGRYENRRGLLAKVNGEELFIPDSQWKMAKRSGRKALFNSEYNVWCFND